MIREKTFALTRDQIHGVMDALRGDSELQRRITADWLQSVLERPERTEIKGEI